MKVVVAPDSFKGSLSAVRAAEIMREAVLAVHPAARVISVPLADGGEGSLEIARHLLGGELRCSEVPGPDGTLRSVPWLLSGDGTLAFVESAQAVGMHLVPAGRRDPLRLSSAGLGMLLGEVFRSGATQVICALGGSAVNDCGLGMAQALGYAHVPLRAEESLSSYLQLVERVIVPGTVPPAGVECVVLHDVVNPLTGPEGATAVYGPQKGLRADDVASLDSGIARYAAVVRRDVRDVDDSSPGCGAAGGLGFALQAFCRASAIHGAQWFIAKSGLADALAGADLLITGEGQCDSQTAFGKAAFAAAGAARRFNVPVYACAGRIRGEAESLRTLLGFTGLFASAPEGMSVDEALGRAEELLFENVRRTLISAR